MPGRAQWRGGLHLVTQVVDEICEIFHELGFTRAVGPEAETERYNFTALNFPKDHPATDAQDSFYLGGDVLLRTHTSPVQIRTLERYPPPVRVVIPGQVYRRDPFDASHTSRAVSGVAGSPRRGAGGGRGVRPPPLARSAARALARRGRRRRAPDDARRGGGYGHADPPGPERRARRPRARGEAASQRRPAHPLPRRHGAGEGRAGGGRVRRAQRPGRGDLPLRTARPAAPAARHARAPEDHRRPYDP